MSDENLNLGIWGTSASSIVYPPAKANRPTLSFVTDQDLEAELERRRKAKEEAAIPKPLAAQDFTALREVCARYIKELADDEYDEDTEHYIYEAAMTALYGKKVWDWISERVR